MFLDLEERHLYTDNLFFTTENTLKANLGVVLVVTAAIASALFLCTDNTYEVMTLTLQQR